MTTPRHPPPPGPPASPRQDHRLSRPDMAAQLVADIIKQKVDEVKQHKVDEQLAVRRGKRRSKLWYFAGLLPVFLGLTIWNLTRAGEAPELFTPEEVDAGVRFRIFLAAQAVQAYRDSLGKWPRTLAAAGMDGEGLVYRLADSSYTIADTTGGVPLVYHGGESLSLFADGYAYLARQKR